MEFIIVLLVLVALTFYYISSTQNNLNNENYDTMNKKDSNVKMNSEFVAYDNTENETLLDTRPFYDFIGPNFERSELRGIEAEKEVSNFLKSEGFLFIENYTFKFEGIIYKIDHLVINENGLFIIETKRWRGIISKDTNINKFSVKSKKYGTKKYSNPIKEHIKLKNALKTLLAETNSVLKPIIFFKDSTMLNFETKQLATLSTFEELKKEITKKNKKISKDKIDAIVSKLNSNYYPISRIDYYNKIHN